MQASHICTGCGRELCRESAPPDPVYGLPIVVCPTCGLACVRRIHRFRRVPASFRRTVSLAGLLLGHVAMLALLGTILVVFSMLIIEQARKRGTDVLMALIPAWRGRKEVAVIADLMPPLIVLLIVMLGGIWFGVHLTHWRRKGKIAAIVILPVVLGGWVALWPVLVTADLSGLRFSLAVWPKAIEAMIPMMGSLAIGFFIGSPKSDDMERIRRHRIRTRLRKLRHRKAKRRAGS